MVDVLAKTFIAQSHSQNKTNMAILDNLEAYLEFEPESLATKVFINNVCNNCQTESTPMPITDNMGREIFWEDLGRPTNA